MTMFAMTVETPFLQGVMRGLEYTPMDIRVEVAMTFRKTLDELTVEDYMRCKKEWIYFLVKLVHTPGRRLDSQRVQQLLKVFSQEVEVLISASAPARKRRDRPRKYPK